MMATERRIVLVRHGHSAHTARGGWIDAAGVLRWRNAYDAAGILPDSLPPPDLVAEATRADCLISSDLPRAIASAERLAPGRTPRISPLVREMYLDLPRWLVARWPLPVWEACITAHWFVREWRGGIATPEELRRAADAVESLEQTSREAATTVVVTHGAFRRLLSMRLVERGWALVARTGGYANWSAWRFRSP